jgi:hypothetical protein
MRILFLPMVFAIICSAFVLVDANEDQQKQAIQERQVNTSMDEYFKFGVGTTWTYKKTDTHGDTDNGMVMYSTFDTTVAKVTPKGEVFIGQFALYVDGDYLIVGTIAEDGSVIGSMRIMKAGMKAGDSWDGAVIETSEELKAKFVGFEDFTIPVGKFKAAHIQYTSKNVIMDFWYAAKVGMVKLTIKSDHVTNEQVLQKYTIK